MLAEFVNGADVGMLQRRHRPRLTLEALQRHRVACQLFGQKFQGHEAAELGVLGLVHQAHSTASEQLQHPVVRNRFAPQRSGIALPAV